jgi:hypothetical protein
MKGWDECWPLAGRRPPEGRRLLAGPLYSFSWRERLVAPAAGLFPLPEADPRKLALLGINPPTAALLLNESIDLRPGDWVAANSGVGRSVTRNGAARRVGHDSSTGRSDLSSHRLPHSRRLRSAGRQGNV